MKKKCTYLGLFLTFLGLCALTFSSCGGDDEITIKNLRSNAGGNFLAINMATNDTLEISGELTISLTGPQKLTAQKGNIIKLKYIPEDEYKDYNFNVVFSVGENQVKNPNNYEYEFSTVTLQAQDYPVLLSAEYKYKDDTNNIDITASGNFTLQVSE